MSRPIPTWLTTLAVVGLLATGCSSTGSYRPGDGGGGKDGGHVATDGGPTDAGPQDAGATDGGTTCSTTPTQLTNTAFDSWTGGATADAVVWQGYGSLTDASTDSEIYYWNGATTRQLTDDAVYEYAPAVGGGRVGWTQDVPDSQAPDVFLWNGTATARLTHGAPNIGYLLVDASSVVWATVQAPPSVYLYDGSSTRTLNPAGLQAAVAPSLDGGRVAFVAAPQSVSLGGAQVYLWANGTATQISTGKLEKHSPVVRGGLVVWREGDPSAPLSKVVLWSGGAPEVVSDPTLLCGGATTDGTLVAWWCQTSGAGTDIFVRRGPGDVVRFAQPAGTFTQNDLVAGGGAVAWARFTSPPNAEIVVYDGTQLRTVATATQTPTRQALTVGLRLRGGRLAWVSYDGSHDQVYTERVAPCP